MALVHCIIPARIGSSRFPGKPLFKLCGREMILRTMDQAHLASCFSRIICATDDDKIKEVVESAGYEAIKTGFAATGSDRVALAAEQLGLDLVVNLQGDEPLVDISLLQKVAKTLEKYPDHWVSGASPLRKEDATIESIVKVSISLEGFALDFKRCIPEKDYEKWEEHRGIYAYSALSRREFRALPQAPRELAESLEQMRILGKTPIRMVRTSLPSYSVDTPLDASIVENVIKASLL